MSKVIARITALAAAFTVLAPAAVSASTSPAPVGAYAADTHSPQVLSDLAGIPANLGPLSALLPRGVDVAAYQHPGGTAIDWDQVSLAGYRFAAVKGTEGDYYVNPYAASDETSALLAAMPVTVYHFAVPDVSSGAAQASYAVQHSGYPTGGALLPLTLDIEYNPYGSECYGLSPSAMTAWIQSFVTQARDLTGLLPIIYTTPDWWDTCTGGSSEFSADPLWVAASGTTSPALPHGWSTWTIWQYTSTGSVPGIEAKTDLDYVNPAGPLSDLSSLSLP